VYPRVSVEWRGHSRGLFAFAFTFPPVLEPAEAEGPCAWGWSLVSAEFGPLLPSSALKNATRRSGTMLRDPPAGPRYPACEIVEAFKGLLPVRE
jgi:hypothetical protein